MFINTLRRLVSPKFTIQRVIDLLKTFSNKRELTLKYVTICALFKSLNDISQYSAKCTVILI